ncbi:unnamed protein product, partial [marine sediment metagenome]
DQKSAAAYLKQMIPLRRDNWITRHSWGNEMHRWTPDGQHGGTGQFADAGIPWFASHNGPKIKWTDIDNPATYKQAMALVADGTFAWEEYSEE